MSQDDEINHDKGLRKESFEQNQTIHVFNTSEKYVSIEFIYSVDFFICERLGINLDDFILL